MSSEETTPPEEGSVEEAPGPEAAEPADGAVEPEAEPAPGARIAALEEELSQARDRALRALAEVENMRRRTEREKEDARRFAVSKFAKDLLDVSDNLRRAISASPAAEEGGDLAGLLGGIQATEQQLLTVFERNGIAKIEAEGEKFDPNLHQAMFEVPGTPQPAGHVVQVIQTGYLLNGRLLRPAMVGISKGDPVPADSSA